MILTDYYYQIYIVMLSNRILLFKFWPHLIGLLSNGLGSNEKYEKERRATTALFGLPEVEARLFCIGLLGFFSVVVNAGLFRFVVGIDLLDLTVVLGFRRFLYIFGLADASFLALDVVFFALDGFSSVLASSSISWVSDSWKQAIDAT